MSKKQVAPRAERLSDRAVTCGMCGKEESAYNQVANMSAKGDGKERTNWWQVVSFCKNCRPKFEKREDFESWMEPSSK